MPRRWVGRVSFAGRCWLIALLGLLAATSGASRAEAQPAPLPPPGVDEPEAEPSTRPSSTPSNAQSMAERALDEESRSEWVQAEIHLERALQLDADPWIRKSRRKLETSIKNVRAHLGSLQISGGPDDAEVRVRGRVVGRLPLPDPLRVATGVIRLEVALAGYQPQAREVTIESGALASETIQLEPVRNAFRPAVTATPSEPERVGLSTRDFTAADFASTGSQPAAATDSGESDRLEPWVFVTLASTAAALGAFAIWSGVDTLSKNGAYKNYARYPDASPATARRGYARAHSAQTRTNVLVGSTAVMAAASVAIGVWFTDWGTDRESQAKWTPYVSPVERAAGLQFEQEL